MAPAPAYAGAWLAPDDGQEIWTNSFSSRGGENVVETSVYWEEPLGERTSFVASPWVETNYDTEDGWRAESVVALKQVVFRDDENVLAVQGGALWVSHPGDECGEGGVEARFLGGHSFGSRGFVNVEAAGRALSSGCGGQRLELTAGYSPSDSWMALGQVFADAPTDGEETVKLQVSMVRFTESGYGVQIGLRARVDEGLLDEPALVIGLWPRSGH